LIDWFIFRPPWVFPLLPPKPNLAQIFFNT
jgi:hypothetical protein